MIQRIISILFILLPIIHCSQTDSNINTSQQSTQAPKNLSIKVLDAKSFNPNVIHGKIDHYIITVTGPDFKQTFTRQVMGHSNQSEVLAIPIGDDRTITIEAINPNGLVIRRGQREGVSISPGDLTTVELSMIAVPIFTNVADKSAVSDSRLTLETFSKPNSDLRMYKVISQENEPVILKDANTKLARVNTSNEKGLFLFNPGELDLGAHTFMVRDEQTNQSSQVQIMLYEHLARPGLMINSGGYAAPVHDDLILANAGQGYYREVLDEENLGNSTLLDILDVVF